MEQVYKIYLPLKKKKKEKKRKKKKRKIYEIV